MNAREEQRLLKQIASITEKAYRRGFQHGHGAALGKMNAEAPSEADVAKWRIAEHSKTHSVCPPGTAYAGKKDNLLERLNWELEDQDMINGLFRSDK